MSDTTSHRATPEQREALAACTTTYPGAWGDCILELRARVEALEAALESIGQASDQASANLTTTMRDETLPADDPLTFSGRWVELESAAIHPDICADLNLSSDEGTSYYALAETANSQPTVLTGLKPPIGLCPRWLALEQRLQEVKDAIKRYQVAGVSIPQEWHDEEYDLMQEKSNISLRPKTPIIWPMVDPLTGQKLNLHELALQHITFLEQSMGVAPEICQDLRDAIKAAQAPHRTHTLS